MRVEYGSAEKDASADLDVTWLADGWLALLHRWVADAQEAGIAEPNAMVLGTVEVCRGSISTAVRSARARPLKQLSTIWWLFSP